MSSESQISEKERNKSVLAEKSSQKAFPHADTPGQPDTKTVNSATCMFVYVSGMEAEQETF